MTREQIEKSFDERYEDAYCVDCLRGSWKRDHIKSFLFAKIAVVLEDYTNWLCEKGYTDSDVYAEEPRAVEAYLTLFNKQK